MAEARPQVQGQEVKDDGGVRYGGLVFLQTTGAVASAAAGGINWSHGRSWIILAIAVFIFMVGAATSAWSAYWHGKKKGMWCSWVSPAGFPCSLPRATHGGDHVVETEFGGFRFSDS